MWMKEDYEVYGAAVKKSKDFTNEQISKVRNKISIYPSYDDLPSVGDPNTWYFVPHEGSNTIFDIYVYEDAAYAYKGTTELDLDRYATDDELAAGLALKVDKVAGKSLSTNDYTTAEKNKLAGIETGAQKNIAPDENLDGTSTNAVQNKAVVKGLDDLRTDIWEDEVAQGNPIYLELVAEQKAKDTKIAFEPTQDFNGYDYPWPAGGGVNKFDGQMITLNNWKYAVNLIPVVAGNSYYIYTPDIPSSDSAFCETYDANQTLIAESFKLGNNRVVTIPEGVSYIKIKVWSSYDTTNLAFNYPSTVTTYSPYSNICPITGKSSISVNGCTKNIYENKGESTTIYDAIYTVNADKTISVSGTPTGGGTFSAGRMEVSSSLGTVYCGNISKATNVAWANILLYDSTPTIIATLHSNGMDAMYPVDLSQYPTVKYISLNFKRAQNGVAMSGVIEPMITTSLPQVYEPYQSSNAITIQLGDTYYGGTLDVDNGVLEVRYAMSTYDGSNDENWLVNSGVHGFQIGLANAKTQYWGEGYCNKFMTVRTPSQGNLLGVQFGSNNASAYFRRITDNLPVSDVSEWRTWLASNNITVCYLLATPTTIQLTPAEINLLKGANTIWTDGKDLTITYNYGQIATKKDLEDYVPWTMVDQEMDPTSENPVSNKAVSEALSSLNTSINEALTELDGDKVDKDELYGSSSVEGNPVTLKSTVSQLAKSTKITFEPVQDLHGYEYPWAGGAGKNKVNPAEIEQGGIRAYDGIIDSSTTNRVTTGYISVTENSSIIASIETGKKFVAYHFYDTNKESVGSNVTTNPSTVPATAMFVKVMFGNSDDSDLTPSDITSAQLEVGSSATTFEPYSNICPIEGWTEVKVRSTGKNILNASPKTNVTSQTPLAIYLTYLPGTYTFSCLLKNEGSGSVFVIMRHNNATLIKTNNVSSSDYTLATFTITLNQKYQRIDFSIAGTASGYNASVKDIMFEVGDKATPYEPYILNNNITIPLGQTVYGGELDMEKGECRVTHSTVNLGSLTWAYNTFQSWTYFVTALPANARKPITGEIYGICSCLKRKNNSAGVSVLNDGSYICGANRSFYAKMSQYEPDATAFKNAMNGQYLCYELATPTVITLTPAQITLLKGINTLWTDGSEIDVTFDVLSDDNDRIISILGNFAPIEGPKASAAYAVGDYLILNDKFCKVTDAIAIGDMIVVGTGTGTNATQTTIAAELALIFSQLN